MSMQQEERFGHHWREEDRVAEYVERMDRQQAERDPVFTLMTQLIPGGNDTPLRILDVGSGYAPVAAACLDAFPNAHAIGLDISDAMMATGRERMARFGGRFEYMIGDFADGELPANAKDAGPYDAIVSARAIHHLPAEGMRSLYADIFRNLKPGGAFFNIDTASPETSHLKNVFREIRRSEKPNDEPPRDPQAQPHSVAMYHHDDATLFKHLEWLKEAGFTSVDCFWKRLSLALVGGYKL